MNLAGVKGVVFGKGPTFSLRKKQPGELHVGLNHAANVQPCDVLVMNDAKMARWLKAGGKASLQMVVIPFWPHVRGKPDRKLDWKRCLNDMGYEGKAFVYNLASSPPESGYPTFASYYTSAETAVEWLLHEGCRHIECHGVGRGAGYHPVFDNDYHEARWDDAGTINTIGRNCHALADGAGATLILH